MTLLQGLQPRARWMRLGTAEILKRFYFCERSLVIALLCMAATDWRHRTENSPPTLLLAERADRA